MRSRCRGSATPDALILAKANLQELAMGGATESSLGGQTRNPFDLTRTPGGSSGDTAAAVAAGFGLVGTGSDTGQSSCSPASTGGRGTQRPPACSARLPLSSLTEREHEGAAA
jgi:Asp-tRNA(Asn)/Glu-tRNA(Gln) amidotransferase A subunit family amidase